MIAIVGGGIAGLAAAYELASRGRPFTLFEASGRIGGLIRTERIDGFTIEAGADSMLAQKRAALDLCAELGLTSRLLEMRRPRTAFALHRDRLYPLPSPSLLGIPATARGLATYALLSPAARLRLAMEPLVRQRGTNDESIAAFFRRRFGPATVDLLAQPLLGGIHAGDVESLSLRALFPRLAEAERRGSVLGWVRRATAANGRTSAFQSVAGGMGELVETIHARLPPEAIRLEAPVLALARSDSGWRVTTPSGTCTARAVILACPARAAAPMLAPVDSAAADLCRAVRYVSTVSVALGWPRAAVAHPLAGSGFVVARRGSRRRITACTWVSSKWEARAPAGEVLLRAYLGGAHDPQAVELSDEAILDVATRELSEILSIGAPPQLARVYRWRDAGAQHEVGHLARVAALETRLAAHPGLFVTGSGFRAVGIPDCIADGRAVAAQAGHLTHAL
ncbi:MAG TPA: protoporphyrinogen oxidase [Vicinamibacterales bacterium]|nr:protoporphyrinogen oxidase [Vicinamibacterales bacterium]